MNECSVQPFPEQTLLDRIEEVTFRFRDLGPTGALSVFLGPMAQLTYGALSAVGQSIVNKKVDRALSELDRQVRLIGKDKIDREFLNTEEGADLFRKTLEECLDTSKREKVSLYIRILLRGAENPVYRWNAEEYINLLADLSWDDILVAAAIYRIQRASAAPSDESTNVLQDRYRASGIAKELPELPLWRLDACLQRLQRFGLVHEAVGAILGYVGGSYQVTPYFDNLMEHLGVTDLAEFAQSKETQSE